MSNAIKWALKKAEQQLETCGLVYRDMNIRKSWADDERLGLENFINYREDEARKLKAFIAEFEQLLNAQELGGV